MINTIVTRGTLDRCPSESVSTAAATGAAIRPAIIRMRPNHGARR